MLSAFKNFFSPPDSQRNAFEAYKVLVTQARNKVFYEQWQVEDTLDGRFDCIVLHLCLVLHRLEAEGPREDVQVFMRMISEAFFADMDRSLREMGASDTGVGIRVKKMAQAFYGRKQAYAQALGTDAAQENILAEALHRNVYREREVPAECLASLAAYMGRNARVLQEQSTDAILQGRLHFCS